MKSKNGMKIVAEKDKGKIMEEDDGDGGSDSSWEASSKGESGYLRPWWRHEKGDEDIGA